MNLTNKQKDAIQEAETVSIIANALDKGLTYGDISEVRFSTGTKFRSYFERVHGGALEYCDNHSIDASRLMPEGTLVLQRAKRVTREQVIDRIKEMHIGLSRGLQEKEARTTLEGKIIVAAGRSHFGRWSDAVLYCGISPARANERVIGEYRQLIINEYSSGKSILQIEKELPIGNGTIASVLKEEGITVVPSNERYYMNNPLKLSKEDTDKFIKQIIKEAITKKHTVLTLTRDYYEEYRAIRYYYNSLDNAVKSSGEYLLNKRINVRWGKKFLIQQVKLGYKLGEPLNISYVSAISGATVFAKKAFGSWENLLESCDIFIPPTTLTQFANLGREFERVLGDIFTELGMMFTKYEHERWRPDFVLDSKWIDAKLSEHTYLGRGTSGESTNEKYEPHCSELELVFLRGRYGLDRKITDKTRLVHVSKYVDKLPKDRQVFYNEILTQIEREATYISTNVGA